MQIKEKTKETNMIMPITPEFIERRIFLIRGQKVMLDDSLAELYQIPNKRLNEQVKRNKNRFPYDFMFRLTKEEYQNLKSQFATSSWGGRRKLPYVFTELGVAMLSSILNSDRAVQMNIFIMRAFVKLRELLATDKELATKIEKLEREQKEHGKHLMVISVAIRQLMDATKPKHDAIGFQSD